MPGDKFISLQKCSDCDDVQWLVLPLLLPRVQAGRSNGDHDLQVGAVAGHLPRMLAQDLMRFGIIYSIFLMGFGQAYYIIFMSHKVG